jgi:hypothetical protein
MNRLNLSQESINIAKQELQHDQISCSQPLAVASILWLQIKTPPRPFWGKHLCLVAAIG